MTQTTETINLTKVDNQGRINFADAIAEAQINRFIEEETQEAATNPEIAELKKQTLALLVEMRHYAEKGDEPKRRELRNEVVTLNMRLVTQVIKKYGYFSPDKFQNGCIGLLKAADTFDVEREVPFVNYAAYCIEMEIRMAWKKQNRAFESKHKGFLDSIDEPMSLGNGDTLDRGELIEDELSSEVFEEIIEDAGLDTLIYQIILPCIEEYGTRSSDIDMEKWRELELQYFLELAVEDSRLKRLTFTEMAKQLGSTPQNLRVRHKRVVELIRKGCEEYGFRVGVHGGIFYEEPFSDRIVRASRRRNR